MDIIAAIDTATGCQSCGSDLGDSPSDDFCSQDCQEAWAEARVEPLVGYREPYNFTPDDYGNVPHRWMLSFDGSPDAPPVLHSVTDGRIYVADVGTPYETDDDGGWRELGSISTGFEIEPTHDASPSTPRAQRRHHTVITREQVAALPPQIFDRMRAVHESMTAAWHDIARIAEQAYEQPRPLVDHLEQQPPADPRERALWLRKHRNTGPSQPQRPPRTINARRHR